MTTQPLGHDPHEGSGPESPDRLALLRQRRSAGRARRLAELLRERPELAGVHEAADLAVEAVRWTA